MSSSSPREARPPTNTQPKSKTSRQFYPVLDGVRVLLTLWVVLFHTGWSVAMFLPREKFEPWFDQAGLVVTAGLNAVDWFFVITGFLLAQPIFSGQRTGSWFEFVYLRLSRLYPLLIFALGFFCLVVQKMDSIPIITWEMHSTDVLRPLIGENSPGLPTSCDKSWANLLFINNFLPFGGCMGWTWSLAIQVHFIVLFPLILKWFGTSKKLIWFCLVTGAIGMVLRAVTLIFLVQSYPLDPPPLYLWSADYIEQFFILFNVWYSSTLQRIGGCFAGVLLAWVHVNRPKWLTTLNNSPPIAYFVTIISAVFLSHSVDIYMSNTIRTLLFSVGGIGHWFAICFFLFCLINKIGPLQYLVPILSHKVFTAMAYPSYCVYLIHSYMITWIQRQPQWMPTADYNNWHLAFHFALVLLTVYPLSYIATRFIEEPIKGFMRDYIDPKPIKKDDPVVVDPKTAKVD